MRKEHKALGQKYDLSEEDNAMLKKSNEDWRNVLVKNEAIMTQQTSELKELQKKAETSKNNADRLREENEVLLKQNQTLVSDLQGKIDDAF